MLVAVKDHAELRAPVADVIVADHVVAGELQHPAQRVADHRRADMADVHRLGDVGGREVDHEGSRPGDRGDAQPRIARAAVSRSMSQESRMRKLMNRARRFRRRQRSATSRRRTSRRPPRAAAGPIACPAAWRGWPGNRRTWGPGCGGSSTAILPVAGQVAQRQAEPLFQFGQNAHGAKDKG